MYFFETMQVPVVGYTPLTSMEHILPLATFTALNAVAVNPYYKNINAEIVKQIHDAGFKVYTYTVNEEADITSEIGNSSTLCFLSTFLGE